MKQEHIPEIMATGLFHDYRFCRLLEQDDSDGPTYTIQYFTDTLRKLLYLSPGICAGAQAKGLRMLSETSL